MTTGRPTGLSALREGRWAEGAMLGAFVVALALASVHWLGLVAGGVLVGAVAPSFTRALQYGVYLGVVVVLAFVGWLFVFGALGAFAGAGQLALVSVVLGLVLPTLGSTARAVV